MIDVKLRWNKGRIMSYNKLFNFVVTQRGLGKTFAMKKWAIDDFIKNGKRCMWMMRYSVELDKALETEFKFFSDIQKYYPEYELTTKGYLGFIKNVETGEKQQFITFQYLSARSIKAISDETVNKIVFDEFIPFTGIPYLPSEVERFLEFYFTIARDRPVRAFFLGNDITNVSPYFSYFNMKMPPKGEIATSDEIAIEYAENKGFVEAMKETRFGKLIKGTHYEKYAIENDTYIDLKTFVCDRPSNSKCKAMIKSEMKSLYIWLAPPDSLFVSLKGDPNVIIWAIDDKSHDEKSIKGDFAGSYCKRLISTYYKMGRLFFDSEDAKAYFMGSCQTLLK